MSVVFAGQADAGGEKEPEDPISVNRSEDRKRLKLKTKTRLSGPRGERIANADTGLTGRAQAMASAAGAAIAVAHFFL